MKWGFGLLALAGLAKAQDPNSNVVVLTDDNFDTLVPDSGSEWFIKVYAPWCGHCKELAPVWEEVAAQLKGEEAGVVVAELDGTIDERTAERFGVSGYPALMFVSTYSEQGTVWTEYNGPRDQDSLVAFAAGGHLSVAPLDARNTLAPAAEKHVRDPSIPTDVVELDDATFDEALAAGDPEADWMVEVYSPYCGFCKKLAPIWEELATEFKGRVKFAAVDGTGNALTKARFAGEASGFPSVFYVTKGKFYKFQTARIKENLEEFANGGYKFRTTVVKKKKGEEKTAGDDSEKPETKKVRTVGQELLPPPVKHDPDSPSDVHELTDHDFDATVNNGEDWFVMFYEPWCTHCKSLKPTWEDLATQFKDKKLNFATVDCAEAPWTKWHWKIDSYPNLRLISTKRQKQYHYEDDRDHFSLANFATVGYKKGVKGNAIPWLEDSDKPEPNKGALGVVFVLILAGVGALLYRTFSPPAPKKKRS